MADVPAAPAQYPDVEYIDVLVCIIKLDIIFDTVDLDIIDTMIIREYQNDAHCHLDIPVNPLA